jgi:hypothetical protein
VSVAQRPWGHDERLVVIAPRIDSKLVAALVRLDDRQLPIAEINRRLGLVAADLGLPKPSYEQVRVILHAVRRGKREPGIGSLLLDIAYRGKAPEQLLFAITGPK